MKLFGSSLINSPERTANTPGTFLRDIVSMSVHESTGNSIHEV